MGAALAVGSGALPRLEELQLRFNKIGDEGMQAFAAALGGSGALPLLTRLDLGDNQIGNDGMSALSGALGKGALPALERIVVCDGHEEHPQLVAACQPRDIAINP